MTAELIDRSRTDFEDGSFASIVIWRVPRPVRGSAHNFKYRLAFVVDGICVVRFDNEAGKGDHFHLGDREYPYVFTSTETLIGDFRVAVLGWRR
jgi:hypothetical protein